jgi:ketosteroid isomerase-like protein
MTPNQQIIERYMDGFRRTDHAQILSCLSDDVEWSIPGAFQIRGKEAFDKHIEGEGFVGSPAITVTRLIEAGDIVIAEGLVEIQHKDGLFLKLLFCDLFEMNDGKIRRLTSYLVQQQEHPAG